MARRNGDMPKADKPNPEQDPQTGRFLTANIGGPGRPKGSRNKLSEQFLQELCADWERHGQSVLDRVREDQPAQYLRVVASVVPKEIVLPTRSLDDLSDEELMDMAATLRTAIDAAQEPTRARTVAPGTGKTQNGKLRRRN
jgi:hypothetical protein